MSESVEDVAVPMEILFAALIEQSDDKEIVLGAEWLTKSYDNKAIQIEYVPVNDTWSFTLTDMENFSE